MRAIDLKGKTALVMGVANQRSLGWAIASALSKAGARLALTYQGERLQENVTALASRIPGSLVMACDVMSEDQMDGVFAQLKGQFGKLDILVHSIAFARREELEGEFKKTSREGWRIALDVSAYSLVALANRASRLMDKDGGSILALSFLGSERVFPNYNVMGTAKAALEQAARHLAFELGPLNIRVNVISAGPVPTLSARGITGFNLLATHHRKYAPLGRNIEATEVGDAALFLSSPLASGITGTTLYVDAGYHAMGY
ncbi:MAG: enoyl-ACP reductase [Acidobacteriia bacterium]|nr:enoyl-ACP reductase [Terriglobia bacterium]